jgi:hypothetical protein
LGLFSRCRQSPGRGLQFRRSCGHRINDATHGAFELVGELIHLGLAGISRAHLLPHFGSSLIIGFLLRPDLESFDRLRHVADLVGPA